MTETQLEQIALPVTPAQRKEYLNGRSKERLDGRGGFHVEVAGIGGTHFHRRGEGEYMPRQSAISMGHLVSGPDFIIYLGRVELLFCASREPFMKLGALRGVWYALGVPALLVLTLLAGFGRYLHAVLSVVMFQAGARIGWLLIPATMDAAYAKWAADQAKRVAWWRELHERAAVLEAEAAA